MDSSECAMTATVMAGGNERDGVPVRTAAGHAVALTLVLDMVLSSRDHL